MKILNPISTLIILTAIAPINLSHHSNIVNCVSRLELFYFSIFIPKIVLRAVCYPGIINDVPYFMLGQMGLSTILNYMPEVDKRSEFVKILAQKRNITNGWIVCAKIRDVESIYAVKFQDREAANSFSKIMPLYSESINEKLFGMMIEYHKIFVKICELSIKDANRNGHEPDLNIRPNIEIYKFLAIKSVSRS